MIQTCMNCFHCWKLDSEEKPSKSHYECRIEPPKPFIFPVSQRGPLGDMQPGFTKMSSFVPLAWMNPACAEHEPDPSINLEELNNDSTNDKVIIN